MYVDVSCGLVFGMCLGCDDPVAYLLDESIVAIDPLGIIMIKRNPDQVYNATYVSQ